MPYENLGREHKIPFQLKCHIFGTDGQENVDVESCWPSSKYLLVRL